MARIATLEYQTEDGRTATFTLPQSEARKKARSAADGNGGLDGYKQGSMILIHYGTGTKRTVNAS